MGFEKEPCVVLTGTVALSSLLPFPLILSLPHMMPAPVLSVQQMDALCMQVMQ